LRGDQTSRTEASDTGLARTISTAWLTTFHLPTTITEPGRVTSFSYDTKGNLLKKTVAAGALTRSWGYTYNAAGEVLTATDPLGHVTAYAYDAANDQETAVWIYSVGPGPIGGLLPLDIVTSSSR